MAGIPAPSNLIITILNVTSRSVELLWINPYPGVYDYIYVLKNEGQTWVDVARLDGKAEIYETTVSPNTPTRFGVRGQKNGEFSEFSNLVTICFDENSNVIGLTTTESGSVGEPPSYEYEGEYANYIYIQTQEYGQAIPPSGVEFTNYTYYLGGINLGTYEYSDIYGDDAGTTRTAVWWSKSISSQDIAPVLASNWLTLYKVELTYMDLGVNVPVMVSVSTDGGQSWTDSPVRYLGRGDGQLHTAHFHFVKTGSRFDLKITIAGTDQKWAIVRLIASFAAGGDTFEVNVV